MILSSFRACPEHGWCARQQRAKDREELTILVEAFLEMNDCSSNEVFPTITFLQDPSLAAALRTCRAQEPVHLRE
jgi:hypothetical protein